MRGIHILSKGVIMNKISALLVYFCAMTLSGQELGCWEDLIICKSVIADKANGEGDCIRIDM